jgi:hypothetical protein
MAASDWPRGLAGYPTVPPKEGWGHPGIRVGQIWAHLTHHVNVFAIAEYEEDHEWNDARKTGAGWLCGGSWIPDKELRELLAGNDVYLLADAISTTLAPQYVGNDPVPEYRLTASADPGIWEVIARIDGAEKYIGRVTLSEPIRFLCAPLDYENKPVGPGEMYLPPSVAVRWVLWNWRRTHE